MAFAGVGGVNLTNASSYELLRKKLAFGRGGEFRGRNGLTLKYGAISGGTEGRPLARRSGGWGVGGRVLRGLFSQSASRHCIKGVLVGVLLGSISFPHHVSFSF
jgi:hypothetical protein